MHKVELFDFKKSLKGLTRVSVWVWY